MADAASNEPRLTGNVPLYQQVEPLNREKHKNFGVSASQTPFNFLKGANFVPALTSEFARASGSFPVVFLGDKKLPVIVMGLRQGSNLFVGDDGHWDAEHHLPAYVRRYPFVSAANVGDAPSTVCIDVAADFVTDKNPEQPFFDANGEPSAFTQQAIDFVSAFEADAKATEAFVERMEALNLFETRDVKVANPQDPENPVKVAEYFAISEKAYGDLKPEQLAELHKSGDIIIIIAHLISLSRWDRILRRTSDAAQAEAAQA